MERKTSTRGENVNKNSNDIGKAVSNYAPNIDIMNNVYIYWNMNSKFINEARQSSHSPETDVECRSVRNKTQGSWHVVSVTLILNENFSPLGQSDRANVWRIEM